MRYAFVAEHRDQFGVRSMCRCLRIQPSGYYAWQKSPLSQRAREDARQTELLRQAWQEAVTTLYRENRLSPRHDGPQIGLDGKWQANFYDPDGTRVELMEFKPVMKPCCSPFTAESPDR